jgi:HK97 family phage major capsid protein
METKTLLAEKLQTLKDLSQSFDLAQSEGRDLTEAELSSFEKAADEVNELTNQFESEQKETEMNAPTELKTIATPEAAPSVMEQIEKALPGIKRGESFQAEFKAVSGTNTDATTGAQIGIPSQWAGLVQTTLGPKNRLYDLVRKIGANGQAVSFAQVGLADNKAAKVKELGLKPNSELSTSPKTLEIITHAHWTEASKQVLDDVAGLQALIGSTLIEGLTRVVDTHIFTQLSTNASAFTAGTTGSDVFAEASLKIQLAGGSNIVVAVNPDDYLAAVIAKSSQGEYVGLTPFPVNLVASPSVTKGKVLAFDASAVAYFNRQDAGIFIGYHADQFVRNAITVLAECRGVAGVLNPNLVLFGDLPAAASPLK